MKRGELLSDKRIEKGLSVSALAQTLGVSEAEIERWESGELPDSEHLLALSELLDVSVEDILRGGEDAGEAACVRDGEADGAADADKARGNGAEAGGNPRRFGFGEARKERGTDPAPEKAAPQESYYEKLHKKIRYSDDPSSADCRTGGDDYNGYSSGERKFGYIVFAVFTVVIAIMLAVQFAGWVSRPRELTMENYRDYLEIDVVPTESANPDDFAVRVTAKEDITDLRITVRVKFWNFLEDEFFETVTVAAAALREDETAEGAIHLSDVALKRGAEVLSVEGGLA